MAGGGKPDSGPALRRQAIAGLTEKAANAEATAVLATLAPQRTRRTAIRASTALQVAVDYLDGLGEQPGPDRAASSRSRDGTVSLMARSSGTWKSTNTRALREAGRSAPRDPRSPGEMTVAAGRRRSAATSPGPCRSSSPAGPRSRTTKGEEGPKWLSARVSPFCAEVPGMLSDSGERRPSTCSPTAPSAKQAASTAPSPARERPRFTYDIPSPLDTESRGGPAPAWYVSVPQ